MAAPILVFDLGGTSLRTGLYRPSEDRLVATRRTATPRLSTHRGLDAAALAELLAARMADEAAALCGAAVPGAVAAAFPGPIASGGAVMAAPTMWGCPQGEATPDFAALLRRRWPDAGIHLLNDMSAAGLYHLRAPDEDLCVVTVSSGIGHKIFVGGRPLVGPNGRGGEIGHWMVDRSPEAPQCACGGRGHLAAFSSGAAVAFQLRRLFDEDPKAYRGSPLALGGRRPVEEVTNEAFAAAFRSGDSWSAEGVRRLAEPLGQALAAIHLATGVERFVLLGGLARALGLDFRSIVASSATDHCWGCGGDWEQMLELGADHDDAGLIGAGRFAAAAASAA